ncbi:MAG: DUF1653 domain-containing protein [Nanoarchaeota archaeon]|nr:DUF1653 domain-containing protein [Nanoarchaeota archaeon]MBU1854454.1 DUF1653 domain-containing protein [Nanoarchaeota archaeon]
MAEVKKGIYKHFKGMLVEVIGEAFHSETMEKMIVYIHPDPVKGKKGDTLWVRPKEMFLEEVEINGKKVSRFKFVK